MPNKQWWMGPIFISTCNHFASPSPSPNPPQPCLQVKNWGNEWEEISGERISATYLRAGFQLFLNTQRCGWQGVEKFFFPSEKTLTPPAYCQQPCVFIPWLMLWNGGCLGAAVCHMSKFFRENRHSIRRDFGKRCVTNRRMFRSNNNVKMCFGFFFLW